MSEHHATIRWSRSGPDFGKGQYSREHAWTFDGGVAVPASSSPLAVPAPWSNPACVDPEEAFVAAVSSCHMLTFLWLASRAGFVADGYEDRAVGFMTNNDRGVPWVSRVTLRPASNGTAPPCRRRPTSSDFIIKPTSGVSSRNRSGPRSAWRRANHEACPPGLSERTLPRLRTTRGGDLRAATPAGDGLPANGRPPPNDKDRRLIP